MSSVLRVCLLVSVHMVCLLALSLVHYGVVGGVDTANWRSHLVTCWCRHNLGDRGAQGRGS